MAAGSFKKSGIWLQTPCFSGISKQFCAFFSTNCLELKRKLEKGAGVACGCVEYGEAKQTVSDIR